MLHFLGEDIVDLRAKCDLCLSNPCQNSASCETKPNRDYVCHCPPGYYGKYCRLMSATNCIIQLQYLYPQARTARPSSTPATATLARTTANATSWRLAASRECNILLRHFSAFLSREFPSLAASALWAIQASDVR